METQSTEIIDSYHTIYNAENECIHSNIENDICTDCGYCIDNVILQSPKIAGNTYNSSIPMKYTVKNPLKINDESIKKILVPLGLECYSNIIKNLLLETKFGYRLNREDRVIVTIYHLLKRSQFPISLSDLLKFSSMTKWRLLKVYRDTFGFTLQTDEYLLGIFNRVKWFLSKNNHSNTGSFEIYRSLYRKHVNANPCAFCMAYFLENNKISSLIIKNNDEYNFHQIENIRRKIKKEKYC